MLADAAGSPENANEADLLNSESEHSEEEELNPDDFSEDVGHAFFCIYSAIQAHQQLASFIQPICSFGTDALPEHSKSSLPCDARISPISRGCLHYLEQTHVHM